MTDNPSLPPESADDNWYTQDEAAAPPKKSGRRWWLLGCLIPLPFLLCLGVCGGFFVFIFDMLKSSDPYVESLATAQANAELIAEIGKPIDAAWLVSGQINLNNDNGSADLSYDVSGPTGSASVHVIGAKNAGVWTYPQMQATVHGSGKVIDLQEHLEAAAH